MSYDSNTYGRTYVRAYAFVSAIRESRRTRFRPRHVFFFSLAASALASAFAFASARFALKCFAKYGTDRERCTYSLPAMSENYAVPSPVTQGVPSRRGKPATHTNIAPPTRLLSGMHVA